MVLKNKYILSVFVLLILQRIIVCIVVPPIIHHDTADYIKPALTLIEKGNFGDMIYRTPGYPLFLSSLFAVGLDERAVVLVQHLLGLLLICVVLIMIRPYPVKMIAGILFLFDMMLLEYEHAIVADLLFCFTLTLIVFFIYNYFQKEKPHYLFYASLCMGFGLLTKPMLKLYAIPVSLIIIYDMYRKKKKAAYSAKALSLLLVPLVLISLSWSIRTYAKSGYYGLTPFFGMHIGDIIEDCIDFDSESFKEIKEVYKKYLPYKSDARGSVSDTVVDELIRTHNYTEKDIYIIFPQLAREAILHNPHIFLARAVRETLYYVLENNSVLVHFSSVDYGRISQNVRSGNWKNAFIKFILNAYIFHAIFLFGMLLFFIQAIITRCRTITLFDVLIVTTIAYVTVLSVTVGFGIPRYRLSVQPLMNMLSAYGWYGLYKVMQGTYGKEKE